MLLKIAAFEFRYILRSPQAWFMCLVFFALGTLSVGYISGEGASDIFALGRNVRFNSPFYIVVSLATLSLLAFFMAPLFVGEAIIKDRECNFEGIVFTTPVSKFNYLYGRFIGGFCALLVTFLGAPLGMILCPYWAFGFPEGSLAPFNPLHYLLAMLVYALPSLLLISSMVFVVAVVARKVIYTYLINLAVLILLRIGMGLTAGMRLDVSQSLPFINPLLVHLINLPTYWTQEQLNTTLISTDPWGAAMLMNRLLALGLALLFLGLSYLLFSFTRHAAKSRRTQAADPGTGTVASDAGSTLYAGRPATLSQTPSWSTGTAFRQFLLRTRFEFRSVFCSLPFLVLMIINLGLMIDRLGYAASISFPETYVLVNVLSAGELGIFLILVILIFSPGIIWREHKNRFHEVIHALPASSWVFVASKLLALICILVAVVVMNIALAVFFQMGSTDIDFGLYLERVLVFLLVPYICFAVLASFLQVVANNRFVGSALTGAFLLVTVALYVFGFQHPLYQNFLLADNLLPLSAMDSDAGFQVKGYWLRAYWVGIAGVIMLLTYALYSRGVLQPLKYRLHNLNTFRTAGFYMPATISFLVVLGTGSFIYYNTNILNRYFSQKDLDAQFAQYEILYRQYENLPMPRITDIDMELAIFPDRRRLEFQSELTVVNKSGQAINTVHLELPFGIEFEAITVPGATLSSLDATHRYAIYDLASPMAPGEQRILSMAGYKQLQGFRAANEDITLVNNGTYFEINTLIPHIGFSRSRLLVDAGTREEYGLEPVLPTGTLEEDPDTSLYFNNSLRADSDLVNFAATLSTVSGQTAVTAGRLTDQWQEDGRSYFHYSTDTPIYPVIPFFSARYAVLRDTWHDPDGLAGSDAGNIDIEIYYHPQHAYHLDLMMQGLKDGLTSFSAAYGPYQYQQLRVMEYPGYRRNSRSLPTTIAHSEANGFVERDPAESYETMAHELAHHWWGHQIIGARVEGADMLGEGLASYSARMLMEARYGEEFHLHRNFVSPNRRYLRGRNSDPFGEKPLYQAMGQTYLAYYKSESVMYALQNHLGEDVVNTALREFVATNKNSTRPYVVSRDFLDILKRTAGPENQSLIEDFFEKITLYEFSLNNARAEALNDGRYRVTLDITTAKVYGDENGRETAVEFNSPVNIGLFTKRPQNRSFRTEEDVILLELRSPGNGESTLEFIVDRLPRFAGIDPYDILIERDTTNNILPVTLSGRSPGP